MAEVESCSVVNFFSPSCVTPRLPFHCLRAQLPTQWRATCLPGPPSMDAEPGSLGLEPLCSATYGFATWGQSLLSLGLSEKQSPGPAPRNGCEN